MAEIVALLTTQSIANILPNPITFIDSIFNINNLENNKYLMINTDLETINILNKDNTNSIAFDSNYMFITKVRQNENNHFIINGRFVLIFDGYINVEELKSEVLDKINNENITEKIVEYFENKAKAHYCGILYDSFTKKVYIFTSFLNLFYKIENKVIIISNIPIEFSNKLEPYTVLYYDIITGNSMYFTKPNDLDENKVLVSTSGGLDSVATVYYLKKLGYDVSIVHYSYGQRSEEIENYITKKLADKLNINRFHIDLKPIFKDFKSKFLDKNDNNKTSDPLELLYYVPNRNMILLSISAAIAEQNNIGNIAFGANAVERNYPDNADYFIDSINETLKVSLSWNKRVNVISPFYDKTKEEIILIGKESGMDFSLSVSCYYPKIENDRIIACGSCTSCILRKEAFRNLNIEDPTIYEN